MKTWGLRAAGWALMFLSIQLTMRIIYTLGKHTVQPQHTWISIPALVLHIVLFCARSRLGSCSQRVCVCRAEDLRLVRLLLAVSSHHRSRLAVLPTISGNSSGSTRYASNASCPLRTSSQEEPVTSQLMIITTISDVCQPSIRGETVLHSWFFSHWIANCTG